MSYPELQFFYPNLINSNNTITDWSNNILSKIYYEENKLMSPKYSKNKANIIFEQEKNRVELIHKKSASEDEIKNHFLFPQVFNNFIGN